MSVDVFVGAATATAEWKGRGITRNHSSQCCLRRTIQAKLQIKHASPDGPDLDIFCHIMCGSSSENTSSTVC